MAGLLPLPAHFLSPCLQNSLGEGQQLRVRTSSNQETEGLLLKDSSSCDFEDFVMVPADLPADGLQDSLLSSG